MVPPDQRQSEYVSKICIGTNHSNLNEQLKCSANVREESGTEVAAEAAEIGRLRASLAGSKSENGPTYAASTRSWQVLCFTKVLKCYPKVIKVGG
jgi:hypothetical protein